MTWDKGADLVKVACGYFVWKRNELVKFRDATRNEADSTDKKLVRGVVTDKKLIRTKSWILYNTTHSPWWLEKFWKIPIEEQCNAVLRFKILGGVSRFKMLNYWLTSKVLWKFFERKWVSSESKVSSEVRESIKWGLSWTSGLILPRHVARVWSCEKTTCPDNDDATTTYG